DLEDELRQFYETVGREKNAQS
ncbi:MAG: hypothetical protein SCARUB_05087, partial [Candidatus Scalindua rubra]